MTDRLLPVNAYTTFQLLDAEAVTTAGTETALAVVNVTAPREAPDHVALEVELEGTEGDRLPARADRVRLSAAEARTLASELERYAEKAGESER